VNELKHHRDNTVRLVQEGKLPAGPMASPPIDEGMMRRSLAALDGEPVPKLTALAARMLTSAAKGMGQLFFIRSFEGGHVHCGKEMALDGLDPRAQAECEHSLRQLESLGLILRRGGSDHSPVYAVTH